MEGKEFSLKKNFGRKNPVHTTSLHNYSWLDRQILLWNPVTIIVQLFDVLSLCRLMVFMRSWDLAKGKSTFCEINARDWKLLSGGCWISVAIDCQETSKAPLVMHDWEYLFCKVLIADSAGVVDPRLRVNAEVLSLTKVGGSFELVDNLWSQLQLTEVWTTMLAGRVITSWISLIIGSSSGLIKMPAKVSLRIFVFQSLLQDGMLWRI